MRTIGTFSSKSLYNFIASPILANVDTHIHDTHTETDTYAPTITEQIVKETDLTIEATIEIIKSKSIPSLAEKLERILKRWSILRSHCYY